jgi:hypothetical protein
LREPIEGVFGVQRERDVDTNGFKGVSFVDIIFWAVIDPQNLTSSIEKMVTNDANPYTRTMKSAIMPSGFRARPFAEAAKSLS